MVPFKSINMKPTVFTFKVEIFIFLFQKNYFKTQRYTKGQSKRQKVEFLFKLLMKMGKIKSLIGMLHYM